MPVDGGSSSTLGGVVGRKGSTPEHSAWSRELYLSAATSFTVGRSNFFLYLRCAGFRLAGKPSHSSNDTHWPPRAYGWDLGAKSSTGSGKLT